MMKIRNMLTRKTNKQGRNTKEIYKQQQQAYKAIIEKTNSTKYSYWEQLITTCKVEKDSELMELLDFYCVNYNFLKGGR